eukprot:145981-Rhodomonas_salina.1
MAAEGEKQWAVTLSEMLWAEHGQINLPVHAALCGGGGGAATRRCHEPPARVRPRRWGAARGRLSREVRARAAPSRGWCGSLDPSIGKASALCSETHVDNIVWGYVLHVIKQVFRELVAAVGSVNVDFIDVENSSAFPVRDGTAARRGSVHSADAAHVVWVR